MYSSASKGASAYGKALLEAEVAAGRHGGHAQLRLHAAATMYKHGESCVSAVPAWVVFVFFFSSFLGDCVLGQI
jgi:hypothetical protein